MKLPSHPLFKKIFWLLILLLSLFSLTTTVVLALTTVKPSNPDGWAPANVRTDATVAISSAQPRSGSGSLEFTTNTITPGQDKADYEKIWGVVPTRTLGNLSALSYEFYRDSSSTNAAFLAPVVRLYYLNASGQSGLLIWEPVYNGYSSVPTNTWVVANIFNGNFWMRAFGSPSRTIDDYNVSLAEWLANTDEEGSPIDDDVDSDTPHVLGPDTYIVGVNVGVGSGWGATFRGYVDNVTLQFGSDEVSANFEPETPCTTLCYVNTAAGNDAFGGDSPSSAKKTIQAAINQVNSAGTVVVAAGTYNESPNITKALTLQSSGGRDVTTIALQSGPTYLGSLTIGASHVTVDGFTITGFNAVGPGLASSNLLLNPALDNIIIQNNRLLVGQIGSGTNGDDGIGLLTSYDTNNLLGHLSVSGNDFAPVGTEANRAFYINPGVDNFTFSQNTISGKFTRTAITQAKNGMLAENTLTGVGAAGSRSAGLGTWGYPDPAVWGHTLFQYNEISGVGAGIAIFETESVVIAGNKFDQIGRAVWVREITSLTVDLTTISINQNSITNSDISGVDNSISASGAINAATNWWGSYTGPTHASNTGGSGAGVSDNVTFKPWLCQGTDTSPAIGFQPNTLTLCPNLFYFPIMFKN
jgi:hypothetical protein